MKSIREQFKKNMYLIRRNLPMNRDNKYVCGYTEWKSNRRPFQDNSVYQYLKSLREDSL